MLPLTRENCPYTAYFCEENAWLLARQLRDRGIAVDDIDILLFSNRRQAVLLWQQNAAAQGQAIVWDYHVVTRVRDSESCVIIDPDSRLPLPCDTLRYLAATFGHQAALLPSLRALVRVIPARSYLERFHSDRSHMLGRLPTAAFPRYPCIESAAGNGIELQDYCDMTRDLDDGSEVVAVGALSDSVQRGR